jgi:hypothetical protein
MKTTILDENKKDIICSNGVIFIHLTRREAISTIRSLAEQLDRNNSNVNRLEDYDENGNYFSISVEEE